MGKTVERRVACFLAKKDSKVGNEMVYNVHWNYIPCALFRWD